MSQDEFMKLFKYIEGMRGEMNAHLDETVTKKQFETLELDQYG